MTHIFDPGRGMLTTLDTDKRLPYNRAMLTLVQITAIIQLLTAFGVSQPQVDTVQTILLNSQNTAQQSLILPASPIGTAVIPVPVCTPTLEGSIKRTSDTDVLFMGTSTLPVGCNLDTNTVVNLQTPTVLYKGTVGSWLENGHIKTVQGEATQYTYQQGWGPAKASNTFTWYVGDSSITVKQ